MLAKFIYRQRINQLTHGDKAVAVKPSMLRTVQHHHMAATRYDVCEVCDVIQYNPNSTATLRYWITDWRSVV